MSPDVPASAAAGAGGFGFIASPSFFHFALYLVVAIGLSWGVAAFRRKLGWAATSLRSLTLVLLGLLLFNPSLKIRRRVMEKPTVLVLVDASRSMNTRDVPAGGAAAGDSARRGWSSRWEEAVRLLTGGDGFLNGLKRRCRVMVQKFSGASGGGNLVVKGGEWGAADGSFTNLSRAVEEGILAARGKNLQAIFLLTDGNHNLGPDPVAELAGANVPVYPVGLGGTALRPDVAVADVRADEIVKTGSTVTVRLVVRSRGLARRQARVVLMEGGSVLDAGRVPLSGEAAVSEVELKFKPEADGDHTLTVAIEPLEGEVSQDNNRRDFLVRVVKSDYKVLLVWGRPDFDLHFLYNALNSAGDFTVRRLVSLGRGRFYCPDSPSPESALKDVNVVVAGDLSAGDLPEWLVDSLAGKGKDSGVPALVLYGIPTLAGGPGPLIALSPLKLPAADGVLAPVSFDPIGRLHPALASPPEALPPVLVPRGKASVSPGSIVLAAAPAGNGDGVPVFALKSEGAARVVALAANELWRWSFLAPGIKVEPVYYRKFWSQLVKWLALPGDMRRLVIRPGKLNYTSAEQIRISANVYDLKLAEADSGLVLLKWRKEVERDSLQSTGSGERWSTIEMEREPGSPHGYRAEFGPVSPGRYRYLVEARLGSGILDRASGTFVVERYSPEEEGTGLNLTLLTGIAEVTGGRLIDRGDLLNQVDRLFLKAKRRIVYNEVPFPTGAGLFPFLVVFLAGEWVLRRRRGLR